MMKEIKFRKYNDKPNSTSFKTGHKKLGGFIVGSRHTNTAKELIRVSLLGKRGSLARNWQGGKTAIGIIIRYSAEMKKWRQKVFERDNYTCQTCGVKSGEGKAIVLHADHKKPFAYFPKLRFDLSNGQTLCRECHKLTDSFAYKAIKNYA